MNRMDPITREAQRREQSHQKHATNRDLANGKGNLIGLRGEKAIADRFGLSVDLTPRPGGDGGFDGTLRTTIGPIRYDVKTFEKPYNLLVEASKCRPERIYFLCRYIAHEDRAKPIGWQWGAMLLLTAAADYGGKGIISYKWPARDLKSMGELDAIVL